MKKGEVALRLERLRLSFFASPTKGMVFYENLLLPEDDKGQNEVGYKNLREAFANSGEEQKKLIEEVIEILKLLRVEALRNKESKDLIKKYRDMVIDDAATYRVIAQNQPK